MDSEPFRTLILPLWCPSTDTKSVILVRSQNATNNYTFGLMLADFWAGYLSGAIGIIIGNPLDVVKVRLQANSSQTPVASTAGWHGFRNQFESTNSLVRG
jgi:hypothetical protein